MNNKPQPRFLFIESCDFKAFPQGGTLSFARQLLRVFGNTAALAGMVTDDTELGQWTKKNIDGVNYRFFGILRKSPKQRGRPLIPDRFSMYLALKKYLPALHAAGPRRIFTQSPEVMLAIDGREWESVCYCFAGVANAVAISRYPWVRMLGGLYEKMLFRALRRSADVILAAADRRAIAAMAQRSGGLLVADRIAVFPTRVDTAMFFPEDRDECRLRLNLKKEAKIMVVCGRLCWVKGWELVLAAFRRFAAETPNAMLIFVGDGEDRLALEEKADDLIRQGCLIVTGTVSPPLVRNYLNAADVYVSGSFYEGWSVAMMEALACGKPLVTTAVSGTAELVIPGENGFILSERNADEMARYCKNSLALSGAAVKSRQIAARYSLTSLRTDFEQLWLNRSDKS